MFSSYSSELVILEHMKYKVAKVNAEYPQCGMYMNDTLEKNVSCQRLSIII